MEAEWDYVITGGGEAGGLFVVAIFAVVVLICLVRAIRSSTRSIWNVGVVVLAVLIGVVVAGNALQEDWQDRRFRARGESALAILATPESMRSSPSTSATNCRSVKISIGGSLPGFSDSADALAWVRADADAYEAAGWTVQRSVTDKWWRFRAQLGESVVYRRDGAAFFGCSDFGGRTEPVQVFPQLITRPVDEEWTAHKDRIAGLAGLDPDHVTGPGRLASHDGSSVCWTEKHTVWPLRSGPRTRDAMNEVAARMDAAGWTVEWQSPLTFVARGVEPAVQRLVVIVETVEVDSDHHWAPWFITYTDAECT